MLRGGPKPFWSLDSWFTHEGFLRVVKEEWRGLGEIQFTDKLKALTVLLGKWHKANFSEMNKKILKFKEEIKRIDDMVGSGVYDKTIEARRKALLICCKRWYVRKEVHWKQMSRSRQARDMDKNIRYFHNIASARRRNNRIDTLVVNGKLVRNQARIKIAIIEFYKELYHQEDSPLVGFRDGLVGRLDKDESMNLEALPSTEEIREVVRDCESSKASSCDGYNMNFLKRFWDEIGSEITTAVMEIFQTSRLPTNSNITWVALAPKFIGAKEIKDMRPISMWLKLRKKEVAIVKLDFQKAYDRVKWSFVDIVLQKMGFGRRWMAWIIECVTTISISMSKTVAEKLNLLQRRFLWSKEDGRNDIALVKWEVVQAP
ncbi:uncharacterized protein LOC107478713 [Arachis duranensis]|uniref:Uncharacterized protein LOC107478713 n=1 Tax=Arachis duranensis TaxID=130453 RepID=A0A6P4CP31_ARADU|nr:uncharacterized protein LOC107478713 [Arachis duranensis]